jgi:hypothetical protein
MMRESLSLTLGTHRVVRENHTLSGGATDIQICRALCNSFFMQVAGRIGFADTYRTCRGALDVHLHESTVLEGTPSLVVYHEYFQFLMKNLIVDT